MRILHTSDWHLGRSFHGCDLLGDQEQVLAAIADLVAAEGIDVVVVAGDVYDRALPAAETVAVFDRATWAIRQAGAELVLISGNHDSATRLGVGSRFARAGGLHLHTAVAGWAAPTVLGDRHGPVAFYGLPYLEPSTAAVTVGATEPGHEGVLAAAMDGVRAELATRPPGTRSVVLAHAFVVAGQSSAPTSTVTSDSERSLAVGGVQTASSGLFDGVDYVALGHLHGCQQPDSGRPAVRYSGSPLAYSFSEASQRKSVLIVDLDAAGLAWVRQVPLPTPRRLSVLTGALDQLLTDPAYDTAEHDYVLAVLTDTERPADVMRRLRSRFPHAVSLEWRPTQVADVSRLDPTLRRPGRGETDTAVDFVEYVRATQASPWERTMLDAAFTATRVGAGAG